MINDKTKQGRKNDQSQTKCWECANAVPGPDRGCDWSLRFKEIDGWKRDEYGSVIECPQFTPDREMAFVDEDGIRNLATAVMKSAGRHYRDCCRSEEKALGSWIDTARALARFYGGEYRFDRIWMGEDTAPWVRWMTLRRNDLSGLIEDEVFFKSEHARMFCEDMDPAGFMNAIRRTVGLPTVNAEKNDGRKERGRNG